MKSGHTESARTSQASSSFAHRPSVNRRQGLARPDSHDEGSDERLQLLAAKANALEIEVAGLREKEEFYRSIVQTAQEGIWRINADSLTDYVNPKMAEMMGYSPAEMLGRPIDDFLDEHGKRALAKLIKRRKSGIAEQFEFQYLRKDGSKLWAFVSTNPITNSRGDYVGAVALLTDIGERKSMERELAHTADLLERTGRMAKIGGWELDLRSGSLFWSAETRVLFEVAPSYIPTLDDAISFYALEDRPKIRAAVASAIHQRKGYELELKVITASGRVIWTHSQGSPVLANGEVAKLVGTFQDITQRKLAEINYLRELEFNQTLVNHTATIILLLDCKGRVIYLNQATIDLLGYNRRHLIGRTLEEAGVMTPGQEFSTKHCVQSAGEFGSSQPFKSKLKTKSGKHRVFTLSCVPTRLPDGRIDRIILTGADLTELNRLQRELLNIAEREQARIGHNLHDGIGQTLTGVASLMEALECELTELPEIKTSATHIRTLVQDAIQEVRHLSHSMSPAAVKNRGLSGALKLLADTLWFNYRTKCTVHFGADFRMQDEETESHLYRIAQEACNNAIRHGKATQVKLTLKRVDEFDGLLQIDDNGAGMPVAAEGVVKGIGLQVMDYRANLIGGTLEVSPSAQAGVCICCRFPIQPV